ncbi:arginine repressor [Legionella bononiensis]|uniref:Arginine repressor n=1 Tax=Legionella bononiensis TaxID=2793102 RepID=A0ABS1WDR5_9GAMM|nr:ArgR family transcriptional regulator [Legionella bononiensis]MBL7481461.1 ArgR family transcriptional regulator [Legionella bononiensis]MBL7527493.1 ArgR family transcriptional regulator [Legionella bononiensis]
MSRDAVLDGHILTIVQSSKIAEQMELQQYLKARGYDVPQATLSRRLKKLNIAKVSGVYKVVDFKSSNLPMILGINISEYGLIVLHTEPGNANSIGYYIDQKYVDYHSFENKDSGILGTIAGDDTLLLIIKSKSYLDKVVHLLKNEFPYLNF